MSVRESVSDLDQKLCSVILAWYVFSREDATSAFKGKGKIVPLKNILLHSEKFQDAFLDLGEDWNLKEDTKVMLEDFVCSMYGHKNHHRLMMFEVEYSIKWFGGWG